MTITGHRRENIGEGFDNIFNAIKEAAMLHPKVLFIYPVHLNPNVKQAAENILSGLCDAFTYDQLSSFSQEETILLDVRTETEFANGYLPGALNIPVDELRQRMSELDKEKLILVYCQVGLRGYIASRILSQNGFRVKNMTGGYKSAAPALAKSPVAPCGMALDPETQVMR